jgi:glycosyltransferase involved in cell wall biosynthesis
VRILVLSHLVPYPTTSGALLRSYNLLREVARHHEVHLLAMNQEVLLGPGAPLAESLAHLRGFLAGVEAFPIPADRSRARKLWTLGSNLWSPEPHSSVRFRSADLRSAIAGVLRRTSIDVVQFETICMAPYGRATGPLPQILVHHNVESKLLERRAEAEGGLAARAYLRLQAAKLREQERRLLHSSMAHIAVSDGDRLSLLEIEPAADVIVVENGVDTEYFAPGSDPSGNEDRIVFVGGMSWFPNREGMTWFLEEVWPTVLERRPSASLVVVGDKPSREVVDRSADPASRVTATGLVPDIRPHVRDASVFIVPLHVGGGTRLKILDAWAMSKSVVSTTIGCEGLGAVDGETLLIADTAKQFAVSILRLLEHRELRRKLGDAARLKVDREFTWRRVAAKQMELYERLTPAASV